MFRHSLIAIAMLLASAFTAQFALAQAAPEGKRVEINGMQMYYEVSGEGEPLVVLHGAYMNIPTMGAIIPKLAESHKVYAVEMQGHGRTTDIDRPITYQNLADDIAAFMDAVGLGKADVFGSGGQLTTDGWTIVPPSHTLESVLTCRDGAKLFISNSLPFLLAHRGDTLDPAFLDYHRVFFEMMGGVECSPIRFPSLRAKEIRGYYFDNLEIGPDLEITERRKPEAPHFKAFADYRAHLAGVMARRAVAAAR